MRRARSSLRRRGTAILLALLVGASSAATAQPDEGGEPWLTDRGPGIPTSLFGTYVEEGEILVYPFYEYTTTSAFEYHPSELGHVGSTDYLGELVEHEYLLFFAWGISDRVAIEVEGALYAKSEFTKASDDPSAVPDRIPESGLGDVEGQVRWRWRKETAERPEYYSFVEVVLPLQENKLLIGTQDWEGAFGFGMLRGTRWGSINARASIAYDGDGSQVELGEFGVEILKRVSPRLRWLAALEGESDELAAIGELQWHPSERGYFKFNCGFGLSEKAPDFAPEIGYVFRFGH